MAKRKSIARTHSQRGRDAGSTAGVPPFERSRDAGDVKRLKGAFQRAVDQRDSGYFARQQVNHQARYCIWPNQSADGRKWRRSDNKKVFPWLGASDARVPLIDKYVREDAAMLMRVWNTQRIQVWPNSPARDMAWSNRTTAFLRWLVYEEMDESEDEAAYLANLLLERGAAALGIWWCREQTRTRQLVTIDELGRAAEQAQQRLAAGETGDALEFQAAFPSMLLDPSLEDRLIPLIQAMTAQDGDVQMTAPRVRKSLRELRETGETHYPVVTVTMDRPCIRALGMNEDLWLPSEVVDVRRAREAFILEKLTETDLEVRARENGWDSDWVDRVVSKQRGNAVVNPLARTKLQGYTTRMGNLLEPEATELYDVVTAYERRHDEDGVAEVHVTVFSPWQRDEEDPGQHELLNYAHGQLPLVVFQREWRSRCVDDSRGYGEVAATMQGQIKRQWDLRFDRADLATLPPGHHPPDEEPAMWGPGINIATMRPDQFGYFDIPRFDPGSKEVEETARRFADEYFGREVEGTTPVHARLIQEELVRGWLRGWKRAHTQILQLCQQFMPDEFYFRVVGSSQGQGIRATRQDIQGPFNVSLRFAVTELDPEFVQTKLELLKIAAEMDATGRVDRDEMLQVVLELVDPGYAERLLKPGEQASMEQIEDEQSALAKMLSGIAVDVRGDEAFQLRKQVLQQLIQTNPIAQHAIATNEQVRGLVERRLQQLDFNVQQRFVNPEIGRRLGSQPNPQLGVKPEANLAPTA